jgi:ABC-type antimicrobial peptide transport system permease subunit
VYLPEGEFQFASLNYLVQIQPGLADPMPAIRARLAGIDRNVVISRVLTLKDVVGLAVWQERFFATVFAGFGAIALVLALVGLYGVMAYTVSLRTHEMGVRMALGASAREIRVMILKQSGALVAAGLLLGGIGAVFLTRLFQSQLYEIGPGDPVTLAAVAAVLIVAGMAASYFPARAATRVDPIVALRAE